MVTKNWQDLQAVWPQGKLAGLLNFVLRVNKSQLTITHQPNLAGSPKISIEAMIVVTAKHLVQALLSNLVGGCITLPGQRLQMVFATHISSCKVLPGSQHTWGEKWRMVCRPSCMLPMQAKRMRQRCFVCSMACAGWAQGQGCARSTD